MKNTDEILQRHQSTIRFKNKDMDFMFNWVIGIGQILGLSAAQAFHAVEGIKDGDPTGWREGFKTQGNFQIEEAKKAKERKQHLIAGQSYIGAAYAYRAALQYTDPTKPPFKKDVKTMETAFIQGVEMMNIPLKAIEVPFEEIKLPGYYLEHDDKNRPTLIMVGGGDTFREDLFYFAGYPGWKRGYNVLMVDLPGQGTVPELGYHFRTDMNKPISVLIDWLENNAKRKPEKIAIYGVSGGGFFTAQGVTNDSRIDAWIASTPITDIVQVFKKEFGHALKAPNWLINTLTKIAENLNEGTNINLKKYAWQFGTSDFKKAIERVFAEAKPINIQKIKCPSLLLMGESEAEELKRQTVDLYEQLKERGENVTLREFIKAEGGDDHCQLNNLRLCHLVVFDWLDEVFEYSDRPTDPRKLV